MTAMGDTLRIGEIDVVTIDTLAQLARNHEGPCVSILLPTHTAGPATRQDPIRFSNLVRTASRPSSTTMAPPHARPPISSRRRGKLSTTASSGGTSATASRYTRRLASP